MLLKENRTEDQKIQKMRQKEGMFFGKSDDRVRWPSNGRVAAGFDEPLRVSNP